MDYNECFVKHTICEFTFRVEANPNEKIENLLHNCICPKCKAKLKNKYMIMARRK